MSVVKVCIRRAASLGLVLCIGVVGGATMQAQQKERTLDEIKAEAIKRAENGMYPLIGLDAADVREAFAKINSTDNDEGAAVFSPFPERSMPQPKAAEASHT